MEVDQRSTAVKEFLRALKPDGFLVVTCTDLHLYT
jgi:hypothetical protein